jgi:hypothetical protein
MNTDQLAKCVTNSNSSNIDADGAVAQTDVECPLVSNDTEMAATVLEGSQRDDAKAEVETCRSRGADVASAALSVVSDIATTTTKPQSNAHSLDSDFSSQSAIEASKPALDDTTNPWRELAAAIHHDDASNLFALIARCENKTGCGLNTCPHDGHDLDDVYEMLRWCEGRDVNTISNSVLIAAASFKRVAIVQAVLEHFDEPQELAEKEMRASVLALLRDLREGVVSNDACAARLYNAASANVEQAALERTRSAADARQTLGRDLIEACSAVTAVDSSKASTKAFYSACGMGRTRVVSLLLTHPDFAFEHEHHLHALDTAAHRGHCDVVHALVRDRRVNGGNDDSFALKHFCRVGDVARASQVLLECTELDTLDVAMHGACKNGHTAVVKLLLADARVDPAARDNQAIRLVSQNGHATVVAQLLADPRVDPAAVDNGAIRLASQNGHATVVERLQADARVNPAAGDNFSIRLASQKGHATVVEVLLADPRVDPAAVDNVAIRLASQNGHATVVERLLADPRVNPAADDNFSMRLASQNGHVAVVAQLLADPRVDPAAVDNGAICVASQNGHATVVERLQADPRVDPAARDNQAIRLASQHGHATVVERLLADPRVDPVAADNDTIRLASENGHGTVVELLLADARVDPAAADNYAIRLASQEGHATVGELLLADPRVDPSVDDNYAICVASQEGHATVVERLLADPRVDPSIDDNYAIRLASQEGHATVAELLLADPRVDPAADDNYAIRLASQEGHATVVELLLADARVDPAADDNYAIRLASQEGHVSVVELLLADPRVGPAADDNNAIRFACFHGHATVVERLLADLRVDPSKGRPPALQLASKGGHTEVVRVLLTNIHVAVTASILTAADAGNHEDVFRLLLDAQPVVIFDLFAGRTPCMPNGLLVNELRRLEKLSARTLMLAVEHRTGGVSRLSDVLRYVTEEFACFDVDDTLREDNDDE